MKLIWNVYYNDINKKEIEIFNIFNHSKFYQEMRDCLKDCQNIAVFKEEFRKTIMYYFGYKCEYELVLIDWPRCNLENGKKIDIYQQVMLNYNRFIDYIWQNKENI